jgi:hypothetical protein
VQRSEPPSSSSSVRKIAEVVPAGDLRASLIAIRDRLAAETDDVTWARHKRECNCQCGMADIRALVALTKRLEETLAAIASLPAQQKEASAVDVAIAAATKRRDELAARRANRDAGTSAS